jgi:hypothetical protein
VNFPGRWIGRGGPIAWPPHSPDVNTLDFFLWGYVKVKVYSQRRICCELKAWITATIENVRKDILQHIWQEVDYKWDVCRAKDGTQYEVFHT